MASMKKQQAELAQKKKKDNIKYLYFSRYLMLRYIVTIFLFTNLFWLIFSVPYKRWLGIITAAVMTVYSIVAAIEQLTKMHNRKPDVPLTRIYFWVQLIVNIILCPIIFLPIKKEFFPFLTTRDADYIILAILLIGMILCIICEWRIHNILKGKDRYHKVINTFKKNY